MGNVMPVGRLRCYEANQGRSHKRADDNTLIKPYVMVAGTQVYKVTSAHGYDAGYGQYRQYASGRIVYG